MAKVGSKMQETFQKHTSTRSHESYKPATSQRAQHDSIHCSYRSEVIEMLTTTLRVALARQTFEQLHAIAPEGLYPGPSNVI